MDSGARLLPEVEPSCAGANARALAAWIRETGVVTVAFACLVVTYMLVILCKSQSQIDGEYARRGRAETASAFGPDLLAVQCCKSHRKRSSCLSKFGHSQV